MWRDLSTYEANFSGANDVTLVSRLAQINLRISVISNQLEKVEKSKAVQGNSWIGDSQKDELIDLLSNLNKHGGSASGKSKRVKLSAFQHSFQENAGSKAFIKGLQGGLGTHRGTNISSAKGLRDLLVDKINAMRVVSGIKCKVSCEFINGRIIGKLNSSRSNRPYSFDFKPLSWRKICKLDKELERLYFDVRLNANGSGKKKV
jgi:hypothetical protein